MTISVENDWQPILEEAAKEETYHALKSFLKHEYATATIYPKKRIFGRLLTGHLIMKSKLFYSDKIHTTAKIRHTG